MIVDLHIHSRYAQATSPALNVDELYYWAMCKGIHILGTGDCTHPAWLSELQEKLEPAEPGLYKLKESYARKIDARIPERCRGEIMRFILTVEISTVYMRGGRGRRSHNVVVMPSFSSVEKLNTRLEKIGNLASDGRPILGMACEDLLLTSLDIDADALFFPAHIWTPWYAMFGSKSGFDSLEEAFGESQKYIYAVESGLDSDPAMNRRVSQLDGRTILSNSDAHSAHKLAREANIINCKLNYFDLVDAIKTGDERFVGTIEFFPEEGKYHLDGHRKCSVCLTPEQTREYKGICPVCGRALTIGVLHRIHELYDRPLDYVEPDAKEVQYIFPLEELLADMKQVKNPQSRGVVDLYMQLIEILGTEFDILRTIPTIDIERAGFGDVAHAIKGLRAGSVKKEPGYDGVYGKVSVQTYTHELNLFSDPS
jgi:DNA helicase II / ATP-dependent DNA helicase PcrA